MEDRNMVDDLDDGIMAADNHEIEEDIIRLVEEHGNLDEILLGQQRPQHQQPNPPQAPGGPVPPPDDPMNPLEEWDNVLPADIVDHPVIKAFQEVNANFLVSDPRIAGNPIIYASKGFLELTGYPVARVLGRNCRFLQGPETDPVAVSQMREAIDQGRDVSVSVLNYRYDGTTFQNHVMISGIRAPSGDNVLYFVGLQYVLDEKEEDRHPTPPENVENE